jgi:hypothetical protein
MWPLADVQARVREAVTGSGALDVAIPLVGGIEPARRLEIHRRHYESSLVTSLRDRYPASAWLVGADVLTGAAQAFVRSHPPRRPCIAEYGDEFPAFLAQHHRAATSPYVQSFAELEWAVAHVSIAIDRPPLSWPQLARMDPQTLLASNVLLQPGLRYQRSEWPIDELMTMYLGDSAPDTYALQSSSRCLEVRGARGELRIDRLDAASCAFRQALLDGQSLGDAAEAALDGDQAFDAGQALAALVAAGMVVDVVRASERNDV